MNNEKKINKTFSNVYKNNKLNNSNNSEDFEFLSIKENNSNRTAKDNKKIKDDFFEAEKKQKDEDENLKTNLNEIKKNSIKIDEKNEKNIIIEKNDLIENDKKNFDDLSDLVNDEDKEKNNENIDKLKEIEIIDKKEKEEENSNKSLLDRNKENNEIKKDKKADISKNQIRIDEDNQNYNNSKDILNNPNHDINKIDIGNNNINKNIQNSEKNNNIENNNNVLKSKEDIQLNNETKEEHQKNQLNENKKDDLLVPDLSRDNSKKLKINPLKIFYDNSKDNLKEISSDKNKTSKKKELKTNTLDEIGKISAAKIHRDANRILRQINKFNKNTKFCPCCCLPCPTKGVLERFSFCDDTDDFIETGQGTSLYFSFFKFSMIIMASTAIIIGIPFLIFSYQYTYSLQEICNNYYRNRFTEEKNLMGNCELYITVKEFADDYYSVVDSPFFLFSSINIKDYRKMFYALYNDDKIDFEDSILSFPLMSLICSITLLIVNILYIIIVNNQKMVYDFQLTSPSDYTVTISNMKQLLNHYLNIKKKYENMKKEEPNKLNEDGTPFDFEKNEREELGLPVLPVGKNEIKIYEKSKLEEFTEFIENNICIDSNKQKYNVQQINICFKLNKYMDLEEQLQIKKTQMLKIEKHPYQIAKNKEKGYEGDKRRYFSSFLSGYNLYLCNCWNNGVELCQLEKEKEEIEKGISELMNESEDINENNFSGVAFVSFNTLKEQEDFLSQFPNNIFSYFIKFIKDLKYIFCFCFFKKNLKENLDASNAPEPEDVIYENLEYSYIEGSFRTFIVYIISIILIGICLGIFIGINMLQDHLNDKAIHQILSYIISLINTCVSSGLNYIFQLLLDFLTKMEKQMTMTEYYRSYSVKLTLFTFFTSAVVPLICEFINESDGYQILISNMLMMFLVNAFVTPIMWTMNFTYFLKKFQICLIERKSDADSKHNMTQRELNDLYELPSMNISYKYSYLAKTLLMTFLYIPIFPLGIVISLVGFVLGYFLEKFNYAYMYKRPEMLNHKLCVFYVNHFDVLIFVYAIGDYIFMYDTYKNEIIPLVKIIVFAVLTIIPYKKLLQRNYIGMLESEISSTEYKDKYFTFSMDYERANPITRKKGTKHYLDKMLKSGKINLKKYLELIHEIDSLNLMEVYYQTRENRYLFDVQKNFAKAMGKKFLNLQKDLGKKKNEEEEDKKDENILKSNNRGIFYVKEENVREDEKDKDVDIEIKDEEKLKEQKEIADMYNNPNFMEYGCTMQLYHQVIEEKNENKEENEKGIILLKDKI